MLCPLDRSAVIMAVTERGKKLPERRKAAKLQKLVQRQLVGTVRTKIPIAESIMLAVGKDRLSAPLTHRALPYMIRTTRGTGRAGTGLTHDDPFSEVRHTAATAQAPWHPRRAFLFARHALPPALLPSKTPRFPSPAGDARAAVRFFRLIVAYITNIVKIFL